MQGSSSTTSTRDVSLAVSTTDSMTWDRQISNQMCADECAETGAIVWPAVQAYTVCALGARLHATSTMHAGWLEGRAGIAIATQPGWGKQWKATSRCTARAGAV